MPDAMVTVCSSNPCRCSSAKGHIRALAYKPRPSADSSCVFRSVLQYVGCDHNFLLHRFRRRSYRLSDSAGIAHDCLWRYRYASWLPASCHQHKKKTLSGARNFYRCFSNRRDNYPACARADFGYPILEPVKDSPLFGYSRTVSVPAVCLVYEHEGRSFTTAIGKDY